MAVLVCSAAVSALKTDVTKRGSLVCALVDFLYFSGISDQWHLCECKAAEDCL